MEQINYSNDVQQRMATYSFDSTIKVSYIFENFDSDEEQSQPALSPEFPGPFVTQDNINTNASASFSQTYPSFENIENMNNIRTDILNSTQISGLSRNRSRNDENNNSNKCQKTYSNNPITSSVITKPNVSNTRIHKSIAPNRIQHLLDRLSQNLILITKWNRYYSSKYINKCIDLDTAMNNYRIYKTYFFKISQTVLELYLWPNEHNDQFIKRFITRTIEIANNKNWFYITEKELKYLIMEMIQFAKKQNLQRTDSYFRPPMVSSKSNNIAKVNSNDVSPVENQNSVCLFSMGESGNKVTISIDTEILENNSQLFRHNEDTERNYNINHSNKRQKTKDADRSCRTVERTRNLQPYYSQNQQIHNTSQNILPGQSIQTLTTSESTMNESRSMQTNFENNGSVSPVMRSVSRDSGFFSPVLNTSNLSFNPHDVEDQNCIPKKPAAAFIHCGPCKTCGQLTRYMCLGCCKEYYCSDACQTIDWIRHKKTCIG